jgi:hypothetical protein
VNAPNVLPFLLAADRNICQRAISLTLLKVRAIEGVTCEKLGGWLECSADTIRNATNEETLMSFDAIVRLCQFFPDQSAPILELFAITADNPTVGDRLERIERELDAIRREAA